MTKEELFDIVAKGYEVALQSCFDGASLYARGFADGMLFERDGTRPMSKLDRILKELENKKKNENDETKET